MTGIIKTDQLQGAQSSTITVPSGNNLTVGGTLGVTGAITGTLATAAQTNITSVGTLTSFRSTGIDDNADALAMTIDASEHVLVGTTDQNDLGGSAGIRLKSYGRVGGTVDGGVSGLFNRLTNDGIIVGFYKDNSAVGNVGTINGDLNIFSSASNHTGLRFANGYVAPANNAGNISDNTADLGIAAYRFKDLYLSGGAFIGGTGAANKLDDYEEGTWTPTYTTTGTQFPSVTYGLQTGHYTKIGRMVTVSFRLKTNAVDKTGVSGGSNLRVSGLPFTPSQTSGSQMGLAVYPLGFNPNWNQNPQKIMLSEGDTNLSLQQDDYNAGQYSLNHPTTVDDVYTGNNGNYSYAQVIYNVA